MASLILLEMKLAKATANGDQVAIRRLRKQIDEERKKRGRAKRKGLND